MTHIPPFSSDHIEAVAREVSNVGTHGGPAPVAVLADFRGFAEKLQYAYCIQGDLKGQEEQGGWVQSQRGFSEAEHCGGCSSESDQRMGAQDCAEK